MNKKYRWIILLLILLLMITGCSYRKKSFFYKEKPSVNYYTQLLQESLTKKHPEKVTIFYREFFREFTLPQNESEDVVSFINSLQTTNFMEDSSEIKDPYKYKVYIEFDDMKFGISIFNESQVAIYAWDGNYPSDYADITDIPLSINIYGICKYFNDN